MASTPQRLDRLLQLVDHLRSGQRYTAAELAKLVDFSTRTVLRDLAILNESDVEVIRDAEGTYRLADSAGGPWGLSEEQAVALYVSIHVFSEHESSMTCAGALDDIAAKLYEASTSSLQRQYDAATTILHGRQVEHAKSDRSAAFYDLLLAAAISRKRVLISYRSLSEQDFIETELAPYRILFTKRTWFCIGHSKEHNEVRTFNLSRIATIEVLETTFRIPKSFSLDQYFGNAWRLIREGAVRGVRLRFSKQVAQNVAETVWHPTQRIQWLDTDELLVDFDVDGLSEITWWILGYGDSVEVLEPPELRERVREQAKRIFEQYATDNATETA